MSARIIPFDYNGQPVRFNGDGWLHATELAERFGKRLDHWVENAETLEYIRALDEVMTGGESAILDTRKSGYVKTSRARADRGGGTWLHPKLAVMFARWLDARFAVWCDKQIDDLLRGSGPSWGDARRGAALGYRAMCDAVSLNCEARGKTPQRHHFINEARLINEVTTGAFAGRDREQLSVAELEIVTLAEMRDSVLIASGMPYAERKTNLLGYVRSLQAKHLTGGRAA